MISKKLIVGNWKMNPTTVEEAKSIIKPLKRLSASLKHVSVIVCPPFPYLIPVYMALATSKIALGVQDIFEEISGPYTGETSSLMAFSIGARYVIVGHSERRLRGETDDLVAKKVALAIRVGLTPIICIGEKEHDGQGNYLAEIQRQVRASLGGIQKKQLTSAIIAYEPLWAIGKPEESAMKPEELEAMAIFIRKTLSDMYGDEGRSVPILYGGSVDAANAESIVFRGNVDGLLVGHRSLVPDNFVAIIRSIEGL